MDDDVGADDHLGTGTFDISPAYNYPNKPGTCKLKNEHSPRADVQQKRKARRNCERYCNVQNVTFRDIVVISNFIVSLCFD